ncbi:hypothetical protein [Anaerobaca lacustris]|uniref:Uncharacterized protein n=1 Tax=Anaerobaca lacustris TaxID=3044600 RepID=A0AAW6U0D9_9BACT|nr:hypothetical protein [Sedimentisphaerales bacterium M17dextr]
MSLIDILFRRSPKNAATPNVQPAPPATSAQSSASAPIEPLERNVEVRSIRGLLNDLHRLDGRYRSAEGELISRCEAEEGIVLTCGHIGTAFRPSPEKDRAETWIAGLCTYCVREYQSLVEKGELDALQAERLSLICNECARMTTSGHLCCPRHSTKVTAEDGSTKYIDPDTAKSASRQSTIVKALSVLQYLFGDPQNPQKQGTNQE